MRIGANGHLTYCSNIHAAAGWPAVFEALRHHAPALKSRLAPEAPFGIGLRLSAAESETLLQGEHLAQFKAFLEAENLYVFTLNGFPYGNFHGARVKAEVFAPDWRRPERLHYTKQLIEILSTLLPAGVSGSISTVPLSYKAWVHSDDSTAWTQITQQLVDIAAVLVRLREARGQHIHVDLEPEPDGLIENTAEIINFFETRLLPLGVPQLTQKLKVSHSQAEQHLRAHIQACFDTCHSSVVHEDPIEALTRLRRAGIGIGKVQLSAALKLDWPVDPKDRVAVCEALRPFAESTYLHQVVEAAQDGALRRFPDLIEALNAPRSGDAKSWRVHFHVPLFLSQYGHFQSTQDDTRAVLDHLRAQPCTEHLEIETYTWEVLPEPLKEDLTESIAREYRWVLDSLGASASPAARLAQA